MVLLESQAAKSSSNVHDGAMGAYRLSIHCGLSQDGSSSVVGPTFAVALKTFELLEQRPSVVTIAMPDIPVRGK
jgi:hypothetical protein